jgi:hypothetical protein
MTFADCESHHLVNVQSHSDVRTLRNVKDVRFSRRRMVKPTKGASITSYFRGVIPWLHKYLKIDIFF